MEQGKLIEVTNHGQFLVLTDGRELEVDRRDLTTAVHWPPTTPLEIFKMDDDPLYDLRVKIPGDWKEIRACWRVKESFPSHHKHHWRANMKLKLVLALFPILLSTPVYAQIDQSLCVKCLATAKEEIKKCLDEAISQEDKMSCQEKQTTQAKTCETGECAIERAAQSGNKSETLPSKK